MTREEARKHLIDWVSYVENPNSIPDFDQPCSADEIIESMKIGAEALSKIELPDGLEEAAEKYLDGIFGEGKHQDFYVQLFIAGAEWMAGQGWISVDEKLPEMDEEVIVLTDELGTAPIYKIAFGHIVDVERCIDYNGWNIPGVKYWMPCPEIPNND